MKTAVMMTMAAMLGSMAWASDRSGEQKVTVCFEENGANLTEAPKARMIAAELFQPAGVKLELLTGRRSCEGQGDHLIVVRLSRNTPPDLRPGALAYALPFEGVHIQVFYDRIANGTHSPQLRPYLLAYVIVHEITHILQGVNRHSDSGVMMAHWSAPEFGRMRIGQLRFADQDVDLIHEGLKVRQTRIATASAAR